MTPEQTKELYEAGSITVEYFERIKEYDPGTIVSCLCAFIDLVCEKNKEMNSVEMAELIFSMVKEVNAEEGHYKSE